MLIVALLSLFLSAPPVDWPVIVSNALKSVVRIQTKAGEDDGVCSGSLVNADKGYVLSAAHCFPVPETGRLSITINKRDAHLVRINEILDLAILQFKAHGEQEIELADYVPDIAEEIAILGYAFGDQEPMVQIGVVAQRKNVDGSIRLDAALIPGDSGGPAINKAGKLIGVNQQIRIGAYGSAHLGVAIHIETVMDFLEEYLPVKVQ